MEYHQRKQYQHYGSPRKKKKGEKGNENLFKGIRAESLPKLWKYTAIQIHEAQRSPHRFNPKRSSHKHIIIKLSKIKDRNRISRTSKKKILITYKGTLIRLEANLAAVNCNK